MRIAVEGCCHGELDRIYASLKNLERDNLKIDLLIVCGDFQTIRNHADLEVLACPDKFRTLGTFYQYYSGQKKAPYPTVFVGGNHEASNYLWELYHGGWVCPNIYFLGFGGVINFGGLRIAGLSGIFKPHHYEFGHHEVQPFNDQDSRSVYHVRKYNVQRMALIQMPVDVFVSHDWPRGIAQHGNTKKLLQMKQFLAAEVNNNSLGSPPNEYLLKKLRPTYWFSAHLHVKFAAIYQHRKEDTAQDEFSVDAAVTAPVAGETAAVANPDEIDIHSDVEDEETGTATADDAPQNGHTESQSKEEVENGAGDAQPMSDDHVEERVEQGAEASLPADDDEIMEHVDRIPEMEEISTVSQAEGVVDQPVSIATSPSKTDNKKEKETDAAQSIYVPDPSTKTKAKCTKFLSLDKCLPNRDFLQVINIPDIESNGEFYYDEEWLAIMRATNEYLTFSREQKPLPNEAELRKRVVEELQWIKENVPRSSLRVPQNFRVTAPAHVPNHNPRISDLLRPHLNPQTAELCKLIGVPNYVNANGVVLPNKPPKAPAKESSKKEKDSYGGADGKKGQAGPLSETKPEAEKRQPLVLPPPVRSELEIPQGEPPKIDLMDEDVPAAVVVPDKVEPAPEQVAEAETVAESNNVSKTGEIAE